MTSNGRICWSIMEKRMIHKIFQRIRLYRQLRFFQYLYLNHFCKQVVRTDNRRILPYKGCVLDLAPSARIYLGGGDLEVGCDRLKGSKTETRVRLRENAIWSCEGGCRISYGSTIEILHNAILDSQFFTMNSNSTLIAAKKICLGQDVMIGRGVVIYDSDHHTIRDAQGTVTNPDAPVFIGDHVWLATGSAVLKGSSIGSGCIVAANSVVRGYVPSGSLYQRSTIKENYGTWNREHP